MFTAGLRSKSGDSLIAGSIHSMTIKPSTPGESLFTLELTRDMIQFFHGVSDDMLVVDFGVSQVTLKMHHWKATGRSFGKATSRDFSTETITGAVSNSITGPLAMPGDEIQHTRTRYIGKVNVVSIVGDRVSYLMNGGAGSGEGAPGIDDLWYAEHTQTPEPVPDFKDAGAALEWLDTMARGSGRLTGKSMVVDSVDELDEHLRGSLVYVRSVAAVFRALPDGTWVADRQLPDRPKEN